MLTSRQAELLIDGDGEELVIIGGGATCFSFGTYWNDSCFHVALHDRHSTFSWQTLPPPAPSPERRPAACRQSSSYGPRNGTDGHGYTVLQRELNDGADFDCVQNKAKPVVFHNLDIGPCVHTWNPDHMRSAVGADRSVVLHEAPEPNLSFVSKNFTYSTTSFSGFISRIENGDHLYLRSLAASSPSTTPTHLNDDFPNLAKDFNLPPELSFVIENMHSSPLRISGAVNMWLHYDVMANIYCQITGQKRVVLFPPYLATQLEFAPGASSSGLQVFDCKGEVCEDMGLRRLKHYVTDLKPGDILFIPPCWPHATTSAFTPTSETAIDDSNNDRRATIESCVTPSPAPMKSQISTAVNVFFKQLPPNAYAAGRDVYGNRDLQAYETGRRDVAKIVKAFKGLPRGTAGFYLRRLAAELEEAVADGENQ